MNHPLVRLNLLLMGLNRQMVEGRLAAGHADPKVPKRLAFLLQEMDRLLTGQVSHASVYRDAAGAILSASTIRFRCSDQGYTTVRVTIIEPPLIRLESGGPTGYELWTKAGLPCL